MAKRVAKNHIGGLIQNHENPKNLVKWTLIGTCNMALERSWQESHDNMAVW